MAVLAIHTRMTLIVNVNHVMQIVLQVRLCLFTISKLAVYSFHAGDNTVTKGLPLTSGASFCPFNPAIINLGI